MTLVEGARDLELAALGALIGAVSLSLAFWTPAEAPPEDQASLALVARAVGDVKRRPAAALGWQRLPRGTQVGDGDSVFVAPGSEALLRFEDGTELVLDERSLVVVERPRQGVRTLRLQQGALSGRVGTVGVSIETPRGVAKLGEASEARVEVGAQAVEVAVSKGSAQVTTPGDGAHTVASGHRVSVAQTVVALAPWPVALVAPGAQWYQTFKGAPAPVELSWSGEVPRGARVQLARDRLFAFVEQDSSPAGTTLLLEHPSPGVTWWRLVGAGGEPLSEARRFVLVEDVAPVSITPRTGEVVLAPVGTEVLFAWTPLSGVTKYRLELSASQEFEPVTRSLEISGAYARIPLDLAEGTWFWRVRAGDAEAGLPSTPARFRLIHRGIPEAPELLNPEIEVTH